MMFEHNLVVVSFCLWMCMMIGMIVLNSAGENKIVDVLKELFFLGNIGSASVLFVAVVAYENIIVGIVTALPLIAYMLFQLKQSRIRMGGGAPSW